MQPRSPVDSGSFLPIASAASRIMLKLPTRLTMMVLVYTPRLWAPFLPTVFSAGAMPAQLTRPISLPRDTALATTAWPSASWLTSHLTKAPPISLAMASPFSTCMSAMTTFAPSAASMRAVPSPRPDAPPVTMKTLPLMSMVCSCAMVSAGIIAGCVPGPVHALGENARPLLSRCDAAVQGRDACDREDWPGLALGSCGRPVLHGGAGRLCDAAGGGAGGAARGRARGASGGRARGAAEAAAHRACAR